MSLNDLLDLFVQDAIHKSFIAVDEEGTLDMTWQELLQPQE